MKFFFYTLTIAILFADPLTSLGQTPPPAPTNLRICAADDAQCLSGGIAVDFSLTSGGPIGIAQGQSISTNVSAPLRSGPGQTVTFSAQGLPSGVTGTFTPQSCTLPCGSTFTMSASGSATPATSPITINAVSGSASRSATFNLTVFASSSTFQVYLSEPGPQTVVASGETAIQLSLTMVGPPKTVTFKADDYLFQSSYGAVEFSPWLCTSSCVTTLRIAKYENHPLRTENTKVTVRVSPVPNTGNQIIKTIFFPLTVTAPIPVNINPFPNFSMASVLAPTTGTPRMQAGRSVDIPVPLHHESGTPQPVTVSATSYPADLSFSFTNNHCTPDPDCTATLHVTAPPNANGIHWVEVTSKANGVQPREFLRVLLFVDPPLVSNVPTSGLLVRYDFADTKRNGGTTEDLSGNGNTGQVQTKWIREGRYGYAASISAGPGSGGIVVPSDPSFTTGAGAFTVSFSFRVPATFGSSSSVSMPLFGRFPTPDAFVRASLRGTDYSGGAGQSGALEVVFKSAGNKGGVFATTQRTWNANQWYNVTAVFNQNATNSQIYVDGIAKKGPASDLSGGSYDGGNDTSQWTFGTSRMDPEIPPAPNHRLLTGDLDDIRIYNRALSTSEIQALTEVPPNPPVNFFALPLPRSSQPGIELFWTNIPTTATSLVLQRSTSQTFASITNIPMSSTSVNNYQDFAVAPNTDYYYRLKVAASNGLASYSFIEPTRAILPPGPELFRTRTVLFMPNDIPFDAVNDPAKIQVIMRLIQRWYAVNLWRRGFGYRLNNLEVDPVTGLPRVHVYVGQYDSRHYLGAANCNDGVDNDADGQIDAADPQCQGNNPLNQNEKYSVNWPEHDWLPEFSGNFDITRDLVATISPLSPSTGGAPFSYQGASDFLQLMRPNVRDTVDIALCDESPSREVGTENGELLSRAIGGLMHELGHGYGAQHIGDSADFAGQGWYGINRAYNGCNDSEPEPLLYEGNALLLANNPRFRNITTLTDNINPALLIQTPRYIRPGESFPVTMRVYDRESGPTFVYLDLRQSLFAPQASLLGLGNPGTFTTTVTATMNNLGYRPDRILPIGTTMWINAAGFDGFNNNTDWNSRWRTYVVENLPPPDTLPPSTPTITVAKAASCKSVELNWTESVDNLGGYGRHGYAIYQNNEFRDYRFTDFIPGSETFFEMHKRIVIVPGGSTNSFTVAGVDQVGNESPKSAPVSVTTPTCP